MLSRPLSHGANTSMRQVGPSARPCRGQVSRSVHGVWMRPMKYTPASVVAGSSTCTSPDRTSFSRTMMSAVDADHHVGGLDDGVAVLTDPEAELLDRLVGDRRRHDGAVHVEPHMGGRRALLDLDDPALEAVPGADLHAGIPGWRS